MADFTPIQTTEAKLNNIPAIDGQLLFCTDSGRIYKDTSDGRIRFGNELDIVDELPENPIEQHFYYVRRSKSLYLYDSGWFDISDTDLFVEGSTAQNGVVLYTTEKESGISFKGAGVTSILKGSDGAVYIKTKRPEIISNSEIDKLLFD